MNVSEWREELRCAELAIETARGGLAEAKEEVRARTKRLDRAQKRRAEILRAFIDGVSQLPLFDETVEEDDEPTAIEVVVEAIHPGGREVLTDAEKAELGDALGELLGGPVTLEGPAEPTADEARAELEAFRREMEEEADALDAEPMSPAGGRAASTKTPRPGESDLDRELRAALHTYSDGTARWARAIAEGRGDAALTAEIGAAFGEEGSASGPGRVGHWHAGGAKPKFWLGSRTGQKPDLQGAKLRDKIRELLGIPMPTAVEAPADWASTPLNMVVVRDDLVGMLRNVELIYLGDLADACDLCGSLELALEDWTPADVALVERDVRTWSSRRPGFPVEKLQLPDDVQAEPSADALEAFRAALYPDGQNPPWRMLAKDGASDQEIRGVLATLWPESPEYFQFDDGRRGLDYTVRGGDRPAYWFGHALPSAASMPRPATLIADGLVAAIRRELRIRTPEEIDGEYAEKAPVKPAKKARPTAAAGARP